MKTIVTVITAAALLQGCATITRGTSQDFSVTSSPSSAAVKLSTGLTCETPCYLKLKRIQAFSGTISKASHKPAEFTVESRTQVVGGTAMAGNAIFGGIPGLVIDGVSGATKDLIPNRVHGNLAPNNSKQNSTISSPVPMKVENKTEEKLAQKGLSPEMPGT